MPNQKDKDLLLEGKDAWNNKRVANPSWFPDLRQANISKFLMNNMHLTDAGRPDLRSYNFENADFSGSTLDGADLSGAHASCARLVKTKLIGAELIRTKFSKAKLVKSDLTCAKCVLTDFSGADLTESILTDTLLKDAELGRANLTGTMLWKAKLDTFRDLKWEHCKVDLEECEQIGDVADLLRYMAKLERNYPSNATSETLLYYRGESEKHPNLIPSVMRPDKSCEKYPLRPSESDMLVDLTARRPHDFAGESTALGELVTAQHFRLPTRLLDVTRNPLVALFHATAREKKKPSDASPGQLHVLAVPKSMVKPYTSHSISVISNFTRLRRGEQNLLLTKTKEYTESEKDCPPVASPTALRSSDYHSAMARLAQYIRLEHPSFEERIHPYDLFRVFVVEPQQSNERIAAQAAAFLMSAFHECFDYSEVQNRTGELSIYHHYTLKIPLCRKNDIRRQLKSLNITAATLYPGLEKAAEAVKNEYGSSRSSEKPISNLE